MRARRQLLGGGGELLRRARNLTDEVADALHHGVEVRCELSKLILRCDGEVGEVQLALCQCTDMVHESFGRSRDGCGEAQEGDDDACNEQDAENGQHSVRHLHPYELCECDALRYCNGNDPAGGGNGRVRDDLLLTVFLHGKVTVFVFQHFGETLF